VSSGALRIAVIGSGISGIVAAHLLQRRHAVTLFEKKSYVGGHTNTVNVDDGPDAGTPVDTGFIVCNDKTYPTFHRFLKDLGVRWRWADMSFGFHDETTGLQYAGTTLSGLFAQPVNALNPRFLHMLWEIRRFSRLALRDLGNHRLDRISLGWYLRRHRFGAGFIDNFIVPMGAAIWSTRADRMLRFPAWTFIRFFKNHGLLELKDRPRWQTIVGGSQSYVRAFLARFAGTVRLNARLAAVIRSESGVTIRHDDGQDEHFDQVVIAAHADEVLRVLGDPTPDERRLFGAWRYERNRVVLHTDEAVMPPNRRAWASWNYTREARADRGAALSMTYDMNRLQGLKTRRRYLVTLNRKGPIHESRVLREFHYRHPLYTTASIATQPEIAALGGTNNTWFCGSYHGFGFHEDGAKSGAAVAAGFGVTL